MTSASRSEVRSVVSSRKRSLLVSPRQFDSDRGRHAIDDTHACVQRSASPLFGRGYYVRRRGRGCAYRGDETRSSKSPVTLLEYVVRCSAAEVERDRNDAR